MAKKRGDVNERVVKDIIDELNARFARNGRETVRAVNRWTAVTRTKLRIAARQKKLRAELRALKRKGA